MREGGAGLRGEGAGLLIAVHKMSIVQPFEYVFKQCNKLLIPSSSVHMNVRTALNHLNITSDCCGHCVTQDRAQLRRDDSFSFSDVSVSVHPLCFVFFFYPNWLISSDEVPAAAAAAAQ